MTQDHIMRFGPAGNSQRFYDEGNTATVQAFAWIKAMGLNAYEYPFGRGVTMGEETAAAIGAEAALHGITLSAHAPYYINFAHPDPGMRQKSVGYVLSAARTLHVMGGGRLVVHPGGSRAGDRAQAVALCAQGLAQVRQRLDDEGLDGIILCPETMGKKGQIGDLMETLAFCQMDARLVPCVDFAHLHALGQGALPDTEAFAAVLDKLEAALGKKRARGMHAHFSTIEYGASGEKKHHTFAEPDYGPRFEHLAPLLVQRGYHATIICESKGTMAEDAAHMRDVYHQAKLPNPNEAPSRI
ncbi:MAG: TIM barrel protein [Clostridiales bacterium]|nr:TIM barrel protein [Clostridiales bacterium]